MKTLTHDQKIQIYIGVFLCLNFLMWFAIRHSQGHWQNVPPVPDKAYAALYGLGDKSFSYRLNGIMIQNLGDTGGRFTPLQEYDYDVLAQWFFLEDYLDPNSDYIPYLVTYYFGGVQDVEKLRPILPYLEMVGERDYKEKWRWLAQAVFLARYRLKDFTIALRMAKTLASFERPNMPGWAKQMPAFIQVAQGEKKAAYSIMIELLKSSSDKLHPNEVNSMKIFICSRVLEAEEARNNPLCVDIVQ